MTDLGTISGAALNQYLVSARAHGLDTDTAMSRAGIAPEAVSDPDNRIPGEEFEELLVQLIQASDDPLFGLHTSQFVQPGSYSVMGYIAMSAATIQEALSRVQLYEKLVGDMGITDTRISDGRVEVRWLCRHQRQPARRHLIENVLGSWVRYTRWLAGNDGLTPDRVLLEHAPPSHTLIRDYEAVFGCPVQFNQPHSALVASPSLLNHPLRQPDPHLLSTLEAHAARKLEELGIDTTLGQKVRERIRASIHQRLPRKEQVAEELGLNVRTLHRRLREENTTWQQILDGLRQELALGLLRDTDMTQSEIAEQLGYSDIRSFQRNFKRQNGRTPGEYRQEKRQDRNGAR